MKKQYGISIDIEVAEALRQLATEEGRSLSSLVSWILTKWLGSAIRAKNAINGGE